MARKKKPKPMSSNPEVRKAMRDRDVLLAGVADAVDEVDRLQNELLRQYMQAERTRRGNH